MVSSKATDAPIIAVIGATGIQTAPHRELRTGGSVIRALLASSHPYRIRGLTRNPSSPAAVALDPSVKVVAADANDPASLGPAFKGAKYVFAMTNFWETLDGAKEEATGRGIVDAAKAAKVELLLWSGVPSAEKVSKGKYTKVHHFDSKARISEYAQQSGVPTISVEAGFYAANLHTLPIMTPQKQEDGSYVLTLPVPAETKVALIDTEADYGLYVQAAIESGLYQPGSRVFAASEEITLSEMMRQWSSIVGVKGAYVQGSRDAFIKANYTPEVGEELAEMLSYFTDHGYFDGDLGPSQNRLARAPKKWSDYVKSVNWSAVIG